MKKDIEFLPVKDISLAIAKKTNELNQEEWYVYIINRKEIPIANILITSKGYGEMEGEKKQTSVLRQFIEKIDPLQAVVIEPINPDLFSLFNEFWVSFYIGEHIFDKKFIFVPGSIKDENLSLIKEIGLEGVLHN
jgi:hypothetical protein